MKEYPTNSLRNVAFVSHSSAGKTMLAEAFLHFTGATTRLGRVEDGTTVSDFDEEEIRRGISLYTSVIPVEYKDCKINILDTPGYTDFVGEIISALSVVDGAVVLVDAVAGLEVGTEVAWNYCSEFNLPRLLVVNKVDRENANFQKALESMQNFSEIRLIPVQLPWGEKQDFKGVIDLITMKVYKGTGSEVMDIPAQYLDAAKEARLALVEAAAEGDDALMEKYFEVGDLTGDEVILGLKKGVQAGSFVPVFASSATNEIGLSPLLDAILNLIPAPSEVAAKKAQNKSGEIELPVSDAGPLAVYVWKTTADPFVGKQTYFRVFSGVLSSDTRVWNVTKGIEERLGSLQIPRGKETIMVGVIHAGDIGSVPKLSETSTSNTLCDRSNPITLPVPAYPHALYRVAVFPKTQADSTKISTVLTRLCEEDMTLSWQNDPDTRQTVLQGMGDQHIDVVIRRATTKFQLNVTIEEPKVPYREAITGQGVGIYRHKKQTGGSGQFAEVHMRISPYPDGDLEFVNDVFGGAISSSYMPAIEKGVRSVMKEGILAGYTISNIKVSVYDGKEHPVDSKPVAFEIAGREAFKIAFKDAKPVLYEPIMKVRVIVPESNMGDILGDMNTRRARVLGMDTEKGRSVVTALVPLAEMQRYTTQLRSLTGGRGIFTMEYNSHEIVPSHITEQIVQARQKEMEKEN